MKKMSILFLLVAKTALAECIDFSGTWRGPDGSDCQGCTNENTYRITQKKCEHLKVEDSNYQTVRYWMMQLGPREIRLEDGGTGQIAVQRWFENQSIFTQKICGRAIPNWPPYANVYLEPLQELRKTTSNTLEYWEKGKLRATWIRLK